MQSEASCVAGAVGFKGDLGINDFVEELPLALRENLDLRLAGSLCEKRIAFAGDGQDKIRRQLILPHVSVEPLRVESDFLVLFGLRHLTFKPLGVHVVAALMQNQFGRMALRVGYEGDLSIDDFGKELPVALGKNRDLGLAGGLGDEPCRPRA